MSSNTRSFDSSIGVSPTTTDLRTDCLNDSCQNRLAPTMTHDLHEVDVLDQNGQRAEYVCVCGTEFYADWEGQEIVETVEVSR
jgi:hypothetical protein